MPKRTDVMLVARAEHMFVHEGRQLKEIAALIPVTYSTLARMAERHGWRKKRKAKTRSALNLRDKIRECLAVVGEQLDPEQFDPGKADALLKYKKIELLLDAQADEAVSTMEGVAKFCLFLRGRDDVLLKRLEPYVSQFGQYIWDTYGG